MKCRLAMLGLASLLAASSAVAAERVKNDLQVLYTFAGVSDNLIPDRSGVGSPLDLRVEKPKAIAWRDDAMSVASPTKIVSTRPADKIVRAVKKSQEVSLEAWITPEDTRQSGPARILTLSANTVQRNFTLGQDGARYDVRLRTTGTSENGIPSLSSRNDALTSRLTHLFYTHDREGKTRIYVNGELNVEQQVGGDTSNWNTDFHLALANELTDDRPWRGAYSLLAVYSRALSPDEVRQNYTAGVPGAANRPPQHHAAGTSRVSRDLTAFYPFDSGRGDIVQDRSGVGEALDLKIEDPSAVQWTDGALTIRSSTKIQSIKPARKIVDAVKRSSEATIEAWITPQKATQSGPARIASLSVDPGRRNFTLGQEGDRYPVRFRTTKTSENGIPETQSGAKAARARLTHVVYTRDAAGNARIYLDGQQQSAGKVAGQLTGWDDAFPLIVANERTGDRPWLGQIHLMAVYSRALDSDEVARNFRAGPSAGVDPHVTEQRALAQAGRRFATRVAPLLARRCVDCHDAANKKGGLDLSRKETAQAGGESGQVLVPGKPADSLLWERVASGEMPPEGPQLSSADRSLVKQWIKDGAVWSVEFLDPSVYANNSAGEVWVQRLTVAEYIETVRSAVNVEVGREARDLLPPDLRADGFRNTAYNLNVDLKHVEAFARLAQIIVDRMDVAEFSSRFSKSRSLNTDNTARKFVADVGEWLFRGPLDEREITNYSGLLTAVASAGGDFEQGVALMVEAMLQSPRFIYRIEQQRGDGADRRTSDYELAQRLSYIIVGGPPDEELLKAARNGRLSNPEECRKQVSRLLRDPRAIERSKQFLSQWLNLDRLSTMQPDPQRFPQWSPALGRDMRDETLAFFEEVAWHEHRPLSELFNAQFTFATPRLARHYGLRPQGDGLQKYDLSGVPSRGGLLTQASVLTIGGDDASMVTRGLFIQRDVLRGVIGSPPPGTDTTPVPAKPDLSLRAIAEQRIANESCGGCHQKFEPLAFGLEPFDGLGAFHSQDEFGNALRADGEIVIPGTSGSVPFKTSAEMMDLLARNDRVRETMTWKVTQFALGRPLGARDATSMQQIHQAASQAGGTYSDVITALVMSDLVQRTYTAK